jgi:predicted porin
MKNRLLAVAGLAALVLSTPAMAGDGWYAGVGVGFDHPTGVRFNSPYASPPSSISVKNGDGAIVVPSAGYKWDIGLRIELDAAFSTTNNFNSTYMKNATATTPEFINVVNKIGGSSSVVSTDLNVLYDLQISRKWSFTVGAGYGLGYSRIHPTATITSTPAGVTPQVNSGKSTTTSGDLANGTKDGLESQLMVGVNYSFTPETDFFVDFRRRSIEVNRPFHTAFTALASPDTPGVYVASLSDISVMVGVRFYIDPSGRR